MDLQTIRAFLIVAETASFSRAAEKLFITQPAVSKRIATLEANLNCLLFDRLGKTIQLTQAGNALIPSFQKILSEFQESKRIISNLRAHVSGQLKFGTSHHIGLHRLPAVLRTYTQQFPLVELDLQFMDSEQAAHLILTGNIELALITLPAVSTKALKTITIWQDDMKIVVAKNHPLAMIDTLTKKQLFKYKVLLQSQNTHTRNIIEHAIKFNSSCKILMESNYLETIKAMIEHGLGWGVLPVSMIDDNLQVLDLKGSAMKRNLGILLHDSRTLSSAAKQLLALLKKPA